MTDRLSIFRRLFSPFLSSGHPHQSFRPTLPTGHISRQFSQSTRLSDWLAPKEASHKRTRKGRPRVSTGGSMRGTTVVWGDYGLRMIDKHRRIDSSHLRLAVDVLKARFRGMEYQLFTRVAANVSVAISGNEVRMGKGKGSHDRWVAKVAVSQIVFEVKTNVHEQVVKDAFRVMGAKLPGKYEMAKRGDGPFMGLTQIAGDVTVDSLIRPRRQLPVVQGECVDRAEDLSTVSN